MWTLVHRSRTSAQRIILTSFVTVHAIAPEIVSAQGEGAIAGTIRDVSGAAVSGAEVLAEGGFRARSDEAGRYRVNVAKQLTTLRVRRLGFDPLTVAANAGTSVAPAVVDLTLTAVATALTPIVVRTGKVKYTGRLAGYYGRLERQSGGAFITREQIDQQDPRSLTQLLTSVPGVNAVGMRGGGGGVRLRSRTCWPLVWLDGIAMGAGEVDLDAFPPHTIHGIEIYLGATTAPMRYTAPRNMSSCGTILLWSRGPDTDPVGRSPRSMVDLERMVATLTVFSADQVDEQARLEVSRKFDVAYPASLFATGEGGSVVAEFVVDRKGRVEPETIGIVASTNPALSEAVRRAVGSAYFRAAIRGGVPVRQIVQQPFFFPARRSR